LDSLPENLINNRLVNLLLVFPRAAVLLIIARDLVLHTLRWTVKNSVVYLRKAEMDLSRVQISNHSDPQYFNMLIIGLLISLVSMLFLFWISRKKDAFTNAMRLAS